MGIFVQCPVGSVINFAGEVELDFDFRSPSQQSMGQVGFFGGWLGVLGQFFFLVIFCLKHMDENKEGENPLIIPC